MRYHNPLSDRDIYYRFLDANPDPAMCYNCNRLIDEYSNNGDGTCSFCYVDDIMPGEYYCENCGDVWNAHLESELDIVEKVASE